MNMKLTIVLVLLCCMASNAVKFVPDDEPSDFAEFEDFEEDNGDANSAGIVTDAPVAATHAPVPVAAGGAADDADFYADDEDDTSDGVVQDEADEDSEFEHFKDDEEFEGFSRPQPASPASPTTGGSGQGEPKLTMAKVPMHFR